MENYICINGKKAELTEEQMRALGIELPKASPFARAKRNELYFVVDAMGNVRQHRDFGDTNDYDLHRAANYCTDKAILEQRALHETLNRLLWRYSMEHDGDKIDWLDKTKGKWYIYYNINNNNWYIDYVCGNSLEFGTVFFYNGEIARAAIKEIIEPFMKAHPEFKW